MNERLISSSACLEEGAHALMTIEPKFGPYLQTHMPLDLRLQPDGFSALLRAIVGQQVSVAAAAAIWKRLDDAKLTSQSAILGADNETLKACGLSRPKLRYARALSSANVHFPDLRHLPTPQVITALTSISGIGVWTAEIYAMFNLARADAFPAGDLALKEAARLIFQLNDRPTEGALRTLAEPWAPWRSVAARLMWAVYSAHKNRDGGGV